MNTYDMLNDLTGLPVMLSASIPQALAENPRAQEVYSAVVTLVRALLRRGAHLVFGGHPTITPLVYRAARRTVQGRPDITLYQLSRFKDSAPKEVKDKHVFTDIRWVGNATQPIATDLAEMREVMARESKAAIFIGGKTEDYRGDKPGIRDEFQRFRSCHPDGPVYLIGTLGGETAKLVHEVEAGQAQERNGLDSEAAKRVHHSEDIEAITPMVMRDLAIFNKQGGFEP